MIDPSEATRTRARARLGQVLRDKWRIDDLLGIGGMAVVYSATHVNNGRRVAIKLLHPELGVNAEVKGRFLREGYAANKVVHPGTVSILDDDQGDDGTVFLVMELLEGETLEQRRQRTGPALPPHEVLSIADRLLDVLAAAHDKGIVHRDIKPENVFLLRDGSVKILDFGIAKVRELQGTQATLTAAGAIGTPAFMPPEQARGRWEQVGPWTDIWAVGATMFTLMTGRLVHQAETVNELMLAAMTKAAPPLQTMLPGIPAAVSSLVDRALAYDTAARWPDARTMQNALRKAYQALDQASAARQSLSGVGGPMGPVSQAMPPAPPMPPPAPSGPMMAPPMAAAMPAAMAPAAMTIVRPVKKSSGPLVAIAGGMAAAIVCGVALWALLARSGPPVQGGAGSASAAPVVAASAPAATVTATASATAAPSASAPPGASAAPPDPSGSAAPPDASGDPSAAASADAAPSATAAKKPPYKPKGGYKPKRNMVDRYK